MSTIEAPTKPLMSCAIAAAADTPGKTTTTVGIDGGLRKPPEGGSVALLGTPGQERFGTVRSSVMSPRTSVVLWLFGSRPDVFLVAGRWLDALGPEALPRLVVAATRPRDDAAQVRRKLQPILTGRGDGSVPILAADTRDRSPLEGILRAALARSEEDSR